MQARPNDMVARHDVERGMRALVHDGAWASVVGALTSGVLLVGFALGLGASPQVIGILAAIPFLGQLAQIPTIRLIERIRRRRLIAVSVITAARFIVLASAFLPFVDNTRTALGLLMAGQIGIAVLGAIGACAWNSWIHDLLANENLGAFFARRLFWSTAFGLVGGLVSGLVIDYWPWGKQVYAYSAQFALAACAGFLSSWWLAKVPEPVMRENPMRARLVDTLRRPLRDSNFRRLIIFMASWNFATNLAAPFITVYLLQQIGLSLATVITLWAVSQIANVVTLRSWGQVSDRLSNKGILIVASPIFLACLFALPFASLPVRDELTVPLLAVIHIVMGSAAAGIGLASGNIGLKLAPSGEGAAYLGCIGMFGAVAAGVAPIIAGALADWFATQEFSILVHWAAPGAEATLTAVRLRHWEFLFVLAFAFGLYALHALGLIQEGSQISEREVVQQFALEARRTMRNLSSVSGLRMITTFPFGRLSVRRHGDVPKIPAGRAPENEVNAPS